MKWLRVVKRSTVAAVVVLAAVFLPNNSAYAHPISGNRDWGAGNHDTLGVFYLNVGNQVGFWQAYLVAYGLIPCTGVDGYFGSGTANATKSMQAFFGKAQDGIAGAETLSAASWWMDQIGTDPFGGTIWEPRYADHYWPMYTYKEGGSWRWSVPFVTSPFEQYHDSDHPGITFGSDC